MWALVENNSVSRTYARPTAVIIGDIQYPANIMSMWTASELEAIGIYEVVDDNSNLRGAYYINGEATLTFASGVVTRSYGTATPRGDLEDSLYTAEETKPEGFSTGDTKHGLKSEKKAGVNADAAMKLREYDWYTLRAASGGTAIPSAISTYQAAVRTAANSMHTKIDAVADLDALVALYVWNDDDPPTRPIGEWPAPLSLS
jgi:hypothetical protein